VGHNFIAGIKRLMPLPQDDPLTRSEQGAADHLMNQTQVAVDLCRSVINTGDFDERVAKLFDEEGPS
jgi:hypothetical protein